MKHLSVIFIYLNFINVYSQTVSEFSSGVISVGVVCEDFQRSFNFYTEVIGMTKTGGFKINEEFGKSSGLTGGESFEVVILKLENSPNATEWKLMSFGTESRHPAQEYIQDDIGMQYVTIFVRSLKPFLERLQEHNIPFLGDTPTALNDEQHFVLIQDPDGSFIELIGPLN